MTETNVAGTVLPTPLSHLLTSAAKPPELTEYRGVLTPQKLDALGAETAALTSGAAAHDLGWMRRVAVRGEDRSRWLSGMVTNTVSDLASNTGTWNMLLNAQGRILGDLTIWRGGAGASAADNDVLEMEIESDQYDRLLAHLEHFIIMDDVELAPHDQAGESAVGLIGPQADQVLGRMGLPTLTEPLTSTRIEWNGLDLQILRGYGVLAPHYEIWTPVAGLTRVWRTLSTAGAQPVGVTALEKMRIAEGIPAYGVDIVERDLPQETSQMRGLHFSKGCYLGQEIVERIRSRGNVHKHLRQVELDGPLPGAGVELTMEGASAGQIRSAAEIVLGEGKIRRFGLAMIRGEAEVKGLPLSYVVGETTGSGRILSEAPRL